MAVRDAWAGKHDVDPREGRTELVLTGGDQQVHSEGSCRSEDAVGGMVVDGDDGGPPVHQSAADGQSGHPHAEDESPAGRLGVPRLVASVRHQSIAPGSRTKSA